MKRTNVWLAALSLLLFLTAVPAKAVPQGGVSLDCPDDGNVTICANDPNQSATFTVVATGFPPLGTPTEPFFEFTWFNSANVVVSTANVAATLVTPVDLNNPQYTATSTLTVTVAGTYTVVVKGAVFPGVGQVSDTCTRTFTITPPPSLTVSDATICLGDSVELVAVTDADSVEWSTGATTESIIVTPTALGTFTFTVTAGSGDCSVTKSLTVTVKNCVTNPGTGTPGYWMNHPNAWPVDEITIGGITYTKTYAIKLMKKSTSKDMTYVMFAHLVSARLNVMIGNDPSCISATITAADAWMTTHPPGSGVKGSSDAWTEGEPLKNKLDSYNNGLLCAPSRD